MEKRDKQEGTTKQTGRKDRNNIQLKISNQSLKENPETMWPVKPDTFFYSAIQTAMLKQKKSAQSSHSSTQFYFLFSDILCVCFECLHSKKNNYRQ